MYFKSRTDLNIVQVPNPVPTIGPAGTSVTDPDFGNQIIRLTDEHSMLNSQNAFAGIGGSADVNTFNTDSTLVYIQNSGGTGSVFSFDPVTFAAKPIFPGWRPGAVIFSRLDPNVAFVLAGTKYMQYDLSNRTLPTPPPPVMVCDFSTHFTGTVTWQAIGGVEGSDKVFTAVFSVGGSQGTGVYACAYQVGKGYRIYNTSTGQVIGDYGDTGQVTLPSFFTIHNAKASKDGGWLSISMTKIVGGTPTHGPFFWDIDTLTVSPVGDKAWSGHWTAGYNEFLNNDSNSGLGIPLWSHCRRTFQNLNSPWRLAKPSPTPTIMGGLDDHLSFNGPQDSMVVSISARVKPVGTVLPPFPAAWFDEILGFDLCGNGKVYRFCHTFSSGISGNFYADNAIGVVDQLNKFVIWTSDWMQTLKNPNGTPRCDVFAVLLK